MTHLTERTADTLAFAGWQLGAPAVDAFFVLSGLVVGESIVARPRPYLNYLAHRPLRLLPLSAVGILTGLLLIRPLAHQLPPGPLRTHMTGALGTADWFGIASLGVMNFNAKLP